MTKTTVTHEGIHHTFICSLTSWKLYEDLIRLFCAGRTLEYKQSGIEVGREFCEDDLHLYQVKPKKAFLEGGYYAKRK